MSVDFCVRKLISTFSVRESEHKILGPENLKWDCVHWLLRECKKNVCWVMFRKTELLFLGPENWTHILKSGKSEKPCMEHWATKIRKNCPKACSKHVWTLLETILGTFGILKFFWFFLKISEGPTLHGTRGNFFSEIYPQNMFKTSLENFGNDFGPFCNI